MIFDFGNATAGPKMPNFVFTNSIVNSGLYPIWGIGGGPSNCAYNPSVPSAVLSACFAPYAFSSNALIGVPSRFPPSSWPAGNTQMPNGNSIGFVNYNNGNGGNYALLPSSPYKGKASDGKDLGADITGLNAALAGVQ